MRKSFSLLLLLLLLAAVPLSAADPGQAFQQGREHIAAKRYGDAVQSLKEALAAVDQLGAAERDQAAAAIHFYSAVAYAGLKEDAAATAHLQTFFELKPTATLSAPEKYDRRFVELFRKTQPHKDVVKPATVQASPRFESFYPAFTTAAPSRPQRGEGISNWPVALTVLASRQEKREWDAVGSSSEQARFVEEFWKRRDPSPDTSENEFRDEFERRVVFADQVFETADARGSTSDRGRVFVLLGQPSSVHRRPLTPLDPIQIVDPTQVVNGSIEQWVYGRAQLPVKIARDYVTYRFVNQVGIGENVLQKEEPFAQQALLLASNPNQVKKK
jgi:GWxTD domain-containing protein